LQEVIILVEEPDFPKLLKGFIVITLFAFLLLGTVVGFAKNYGTNTDIINDKIGLDTINSTLSSTEATAKNWQKQMEGFGQGSTFEKLLDILGFMAVGMFNLVITMVNFIIAPFTIFANILINVLGVPLIVVAIINVMIILSIIFGVWSLLKRGV
jgi:hypothetical protein